MNKKEAKNLYIKKQIMFNKEQDYNFIVYNNLLLLTFFNCVSEEKKWQDYRKLVYLYPYITDNYLIELLNRATDNENSSLHDSDKELLRETYTKSYLMNNTLKAILLNLEKNNIVSFSKNDARHTIDLWVNTKSISKVLLDSPLFEFEYENLKRIKTIFPRLRTMTLKTILEKIYKENEVDIWEV